jgi:hypothetical protein
MKMYRYVAVLCCLLVLPLLFTSFIVGKDTKKKVKGDICSASNPVSICAAANTCGSASSPCSIDIKRGQGTLATATPNIPDDKSNKPFCIKVGTSITFMSSSKKIPASLLTSAAPIPFDHEGAIMGGADRPITVVAKHPGCYTYSVGACTAGTIYGMCGNADTQLVISAK